MLVHNLQLYACHAGRGEFTSGGHASRFRLLLWNNTLLVTSGGLRREGLRTGLDYFMLAQIQEAARR